jgi:tripartite-type tricarboxylate transporter receptor subunit TctC
VPTLDEAGVKGYEATTFTGIFAPTGTPKDILERLHGGLRKALAHHAVRERFRGMGVDIMEMGQDEFAAYVRADYDKWLKVAREGNIVVE